MIMILQHHTKDKEDEFAVEKVDSIISLDSADAEIPNSSSSELKRDSAGSAEIKLEGNSFWLIGQAHTIVVGFFYTWNIINSVTYYCASVR